MDHLLCHAGALDLSAAPRLILSLCLSLLVTCVCVILFRTVPEVPSAQPLGQFGLQALLCLQAWIKAKVLWSLPLEGSLGDREGNHYQL